MAPANALQAGMNAEYVTADGVKVRVEPQTTWNNNDGAYDDELETMSQSLFKCSFKFVKSLWIGRLGVLSDYWHLIKLIKI